MNVAALLFCLAALGGIAMVVLRVRGWLRPPTGLAVVHGLVALTGFGWLLNEWVTVGLPVWGQVATVGFGLTTLGGATLFLGFHVRGKGLPLGAMVAHGLVAATSLGILLVGLALEPRGRSLTSVPTPATGASTAPDTYKPSQP